jgi:hypothetical protein
MDPRSSLMMADYCQNTYKPVYRIKEWYKPVHSVGYFYYDPKIVQSISLVTVTTIIPQLQSIK